MTVTLLSQTARLWVFVILVALVPAGLAAAPFAAYVMDARNGKPIYQQNEHTKLHPASLTKMMTLYMAFTAVEQGRVRLDSKFVISSNAAAEQPSKLGLKAGQRIELRYLLRAAAIKSANDAATAVGEGLAGSEEAFARQMTQMAHALGMKNTQFRNAHGLTRSGHYSTAYDMTLLGRRLFYDFPQYYNLFSRRSADAGIATVSSTNKRFLDSYRGADGIKTGYTRAAGFNLTASAQRGKKRLIGTVFGGTSTAQRNQVMAQLLDSSFQRVPERVRTVGLSPAPTLKTKVVRQAKVAPKPAATQPKPVALVLRSSEPPAGRASLVSAQIDAAVRQAARAAPVSNLALRISQRPKPRPGGNEPVASVTATSASSGATSSVRRPVPAPRSTSRAEIPNKGPGNPSLAQIDPPQSNLTERARTGAMELRVSEVPEPRSETVILAAMGEGDISTPEVLEVVSRLPNSGRGWGVSLGVYSSKAAADSLLVHTALQGGSALADSRRRVADTRKGFQARLENLTKAQAQLTCERLQSRQQDCKVIGL